MNCNGDDESLLCVLRRQQKNADQPRDNTDRGNRVVAIFRNDGADIVLTVQEDSRIGF